MIKTTTTQATSWRVPLDPSSLAESEEWLLEGKHDRECFVDQFCEKPVTKVSG